MNTKAKHDEPAADPLIGEPIEEAQVHSPAADEADQGILQNVLMTCADFLPDHDRQWPNRHIGSQPQGFRLIVGSIAGIATGAERHEQEYKGKMLMSVWLHGAFVGTVRATGEVLEAVSVIPPQAYALKIERMLKETGEPVPIDIDIGLEATGRTIPYRWFSIDYSESKQRDAALALARKGQRRLERDLPGRIGAPPRLLGSQ